MNANKIKNVQTGTQAAPAPALNVAAAPFAFKAWTPAPAAPVDIVGDKLKKHGVIDVEEVKTFKTLLIDLKKNLDDNKEGVISMELFKRIGDLKLCQTKEIKCSEESLKSSVNPSLVEREIKEAIEGITKMKKNYSQHNKGGQGGKGGYNQNYNNGGEGNDFSKGTVK